MTMIQSVLKPSLRRRFLQAGLVASTLLTLPTWAQVAATTTALPGPLVNVTWLAAHRDDVTILDIRSKPAAFAAEPKFEVNAKSGERSLVSMGGHVAGAVLVDAKTIRTTVVERGLKVQFMLPSREAFESMARDWGVTAGRPVVIVSPGLDATDVNDATRLYWQFKVYGLDAVAVLNGGMAAWHAAQQAYATGAAPTTTRGNWSASDRRSAYLATSDDVALAVASKQDQLLDARNDSMYYGLSKRAYVNAYGHIPGAKLLSADVMVAGDGEVAAYFLPTATYRDLLRLSGLDPEQPVIAYCNSGHLSSTAWFVASELLGNRRARLYDGSMHQWALEQRPVASVARP